MNHYNEFKRDISQVLDFVISSDPLHAKWLNTLSYLENCGARKIAACQHPTLTREEMLKHAAEEFRHAHYLKKQISKVSAHDLEDYSRRHLLGGSASLHYLHQLDLKASRYLLKCMKLAKSEIRKIAYLLVTYAIELRAEELYTTYDLALRSNGSKVKVKSILLEEKEHLNEMIEAISQIPAGQESALEVCAMERNLCKLWMSKLMTELKLGGISDS
ncbi:MAG: hypothetical protein H0U49_03560 [Parachlamydiaceae bacterium]|nr:hypothetical protein [Parachlamydiaceae bacterium]